MFGCWAVLFLSAVLATGSPASNTMERARSGHSVQDCSKGTDSLNMRLLGQCDTPGYAHCVYVSGKYAYVADEPAGLYIIDVSMPAGAHVVGYSSKPQWAHGVRLYGSYACVADAWNGLWTIDVSDPANPQVAGQCGQIGECKDIEVSGWYAYLAAFDYGLRIVDISDPLNPHEVGKLSLAGSTYDVYVSGIYAYMAAGGGGLHIVDVSDPTNPQETGNCSTNGSACGVYVSGDIAYVANRYAGLCVVDVSDPAKPHKIGSCDTPGDALKIHVSGFFAYIADGESGLRMMDVSDPANPHECGFYDTPSSGRGLWVIDPYVYVADGDCGLIILGSLLKNSAPVCDAGGPYREECSGSEGTDVTLDGTGSYDPDGDSLRYSWSAPGVVFDDSTLPMPTGAFPLGSTLVSLTVSDGELTDSCFTSVEVSDTRPPVITCPPNMTREADDECNVTYRCPAASATDVCDTEPTIKSKPPLPTTFHGVGIHTITWIATDGSGNEDTCYQTITVVDTTKPTLVCPPNVTMNADSICQATYFGPPATAIDNCDPRPKVTSIPPLPATFTGDWAHMIIWIATDPSGNADTCYQVVTVVDSMRPRIVCPPDTSLDADTNCRSTYRGPAATATDNCDPEPNIYSIPPLPAPLSGIGAHTITWLSMDASGNADTCYQTVTIVDKMKPRITCPPRAVLDTDGNCQATYTGPPAGAIDNCDPKPEITSIPPLPATFTGVGNYVIRWIASDSSGNSDTCYQTVTLVDRMKPAITCPIDDTLDADENCQAVYTGPSATATDNCDPEPEIASIPPLPAIFTGVGTYTITWIATDTSGNADTCYQSVTVIDVTPPVITCPRDSTMKANDKCQVTYSGPPATATDNCDASPKIASAPSLPATFTGVGTYMITWTATDASGNKSTCDQKITVIDVTPPTITCPKDVVLPGDLNCEVIYAGPLASAVDNCDSRPKITSVPPLPATFRGVGNHTIVYTATDASGNSSTCTQTVAIIDVTPPVIVCPPDTAMAASGLDCSVTYSGPSATAFDNCDGNPVVTSVPALPATFYTIGKHDIVFTATDFSGNASVCKMTVTVSMTSYCLKNETIPALQALLPTGKKKIDEKIDKAIEHLWHSLNVDPKHPGKPWKKEALWLDATHLDPKHGEPVFEEEEKVAKYLAEAMKEKECPPDIEDDLMAAITSVVSCDQMLARIQIDDAKKAGGDPKEIEKAEKEMAKGKEEEEGEEYEKAVEHYESAWKHAIKAMKKNLLAGGQSAVEVASPCTFALSQNSPNPFTRETTISFMLPVPGYTTLRVYDVTGREVAMLVDEDMEPGVYTVKWNRECCSSGIYFYKLESGNRSLTKKMTVIK